MKLRKIAWILMMSSLCTMVAPVIDAEATPVISYNDVQTVSTLSGPLAPVVFLSGLFLLEGFEVYDALKVNNFGVIQVKTIPFLPEEGEPNTVVEKIHPDTGEVMQRRYYDENGKAFLDIDLSDHGYPDAHPWEIPDGRKAHKHTFDWSKQGKSKRSIGSELIFYEYVKYVQLPDAFRE